MTKKHTSGVLLSSVIMFLLGILLFLWAPEKLVTIEIGLVTIIAVTMLISWVFIGRNSYFVLTSLISALAVLEVLLFYTEYKTLTHVLFGIFAFLSFILSVLSVSKTKLPKKTSTKPYYESKPVKVKKSVVEKKTVKKADLPRLGFYDVKTKKKFTSTNYTFKVINGRRFAVTKAPSNHEAYRVVGAVKTAKKVTKKKVLKKTAKKAPPKKKAVAKQKPLKKVTKKKVTKKTVKKAPAKKKAIVNRKPVKKGTKKKVTKKTVRKSPVKKVVKKNQKKSTEKITTKDGRDIIININEG